MTLSALLVSTLVVVFTQGDSVGAADAAPTIDLSNPAATINDPAAGLLPVDTTCTTGKVDLNTASAADLSSALGIASGPTVDRLIALRPWLKGADLSSVPGIGPSLAAQIAPKTCATQPAPTAAQPRACLTNQQIDLNTAPAGTIHSKLGLPNVAVQALIAARPLPQNLSQVIAPRVPGFPQPTVDTLSQQGRICVTPAPYVASGNIVYRWATWTGGAVVRSGPYGLIVPPGRITDTAGAYISVTPMDPGDDGLPRMDATIHGDWSVGTTTVAVQGPWDNRDSSLRPAVFHDATGGTRLSIGDGTALSSVDGQSTVTSLAYSLSTFDFGASTCTPQTPAFAGAAAPLCLSNLTDGSLRDAWLAQASSVGSASAQSLKPNPPCPDISTSVSQTHSTGALPYGIICDVESDALPPNSPGTVDWSMTNPAYASILDGLARAGVVYEYSATDRLSTHAVTGGVEDNPIVGAILTALSGNHLLFPGQSLVTPKQTSFLASEEQVHVTVGGTADWEAIDALVGALAEQASTTVQTVYDAVEDAQSCAHLDDSAVSCVKSLVEQAIANAQKLTTKDTGPFKILGALTKVFKAITAGEFLASVGQAFVFQFIGGTDVVFTNIPNAPTLDQEGRPVLPDCLNHDDSKWHVDEACQGAFYSRIQITPGSGGPGLPNGKIARDAQGHAYFINLDSQTIQPITTGGIYLCLANHYIVDWDAHIANYDVALTMSNAPATCDNSVPDARPINTADNPNAYVVLRQSNGAAWVVVPMNGHEYRYAISSGREFACWVDPDPTSGAGESDVWDQVTQAQLDNYPAETTLAVSNCPGF